MKSLPARFRPCIVSIMDDALTSAVWSIPSELGLQSLPIKLTAVTPEEETLVYGSSWPLVAAEADPS